MKRILRGASNNINQAAKVANSTGEVPPTMRHDVARLAQTMPRVDAFVDRVSPFFIRDDDAESDAQ